MARGGHSSSLCAGLSLSRPLSLRSTGSRRAGSVIVAHGPSCSVASGIFPDQGSNPCPLHWQADSQPLRHQGSPYDTSSTNACCKKILASKCQPQRVLHLRAHYEVMSGGTLGPNNCARIHWLGTGQGLLCSAVFCFETQSSWRKKQGEEAGKMFEVPASSRPDTPPLRSSDAAD